MGYRSYITALFLLLIILQVAVYSSTINASAAPPLEKEWSISVEGPVYHIQIAGNGDYTVFAVDTPPKIYIVDTSTGKILWTYTYSNSSLSIELARMDPTGSFIAVILYWKSGDQYYFKVQAISIKSKKVLWESNVYTGGGWDLDFTNDGKTILVSTASNYLLALNANSGGELWRLRLPVNATYGLSLYDNRLYIGGFIQEPYAGAIIAVDIAQRKILWVNKNLEDAVLAVAYDPLENKVYGGLGIDVGYNQYAGKVVAVNALNGNKIWESEEFDDYVWSLAVLGTKHVVAAVETQGFLILNKDDGSLSYEYSLEPGEYASAVAVSNKYHGIIISYYSANEERGYVEFLRANLASWPTTTTTTPPTTTTTTTAQTTTIPTSRAYWGVKWLSKPYLDSDGIFAIPSWLSVSLDDKYVAMTYIGKEHLRLVVIDTRTGEELINTPLPVTGKYYWTDGLVWSPDSSILTIYSRTYYDEKYSNEEYFILSYDLSNKEVRWLNYTTVEDVVAVNDVYILIAPEESGYVFELALMRTGEVMGNITLPDDIRGGLGDYYFYKMVSNTSEDNSNVLLIYNGAYENKSKIIIVDVFFKNIRVVKEFPSQSIVYATFVSSGEYVLLQLVDDNGKHVSALMNPENGEIIKYFEDTIPLENPLHGKLIGFRDEATRNSRRYIFYELDTGKTYQYEPKCLFPTHLLSNGDLLGFTTILDSNNNIIGYRLVYLEKGLTSKPSDVCQLQTTQPTTTSQPTASQTTTTQPTSGATTTSQSTPAQQATTQQTPTQTSTATTGSATLIPGFLSGYLLFIIIAVVIIVIVVIAVVIAKRRRRQQPYYQPPPPPPPPPY